MKPDKVGVEEKEKLFFLPSDFCRLLNFYRPRARRSHPDSEKVLRAIKVAIPPGSLFSSAAFRITMKIFDVTHTIMLCCCLRLVRVAECENMYLGWGPDTKFSGLSDAAAFLIAVNEPSLTCEHKTLPPPKNCVGV